MPNTSLKKSDYRIEAQIFVRLSDISIHPDIPEALVSVCEDISRVRLRQYGLQSVAVSEFASALQPYVLNDKSRQYHLIGGALGYVLARTDAPDAIIRCLEVTNARAASRVIADEARRIAACGALLCSGGSSGERPLRRLWDVLDRPLRKEFLGTTKWSVLAQNLGISRNKFRTRRSTPASQVAGQFQQVELNFYNPGLFD